MGGKGDIFAAYALSLLFAAVGGMLVHHFTVWRGWPALALAALSLAAAFVFCHDGTLMLIRAIRKRKEKRQ